MIFIVDMKIVYMKIGKGETMRTLMWFREDLRVHDNTALFHAAETKNEVFAVYIIAQDDWVQHDVASCRIDFIFSQLSLLNDQLAALNIPFYLLEAKKNTSIPPLLLNFIKEQQISALYFNEQYGIDELRRDQAIERLLKKNQIAVYAYTDEVILAPGDVLTEKGDYYTIFTFFKKKWLALLHHQKIIHHPAPKKQKFISANSALPFHPSENTLWPAGETAAQQKLTFFMKNKIKNYAKNRDFPDLNGTSQLSPYLALGILSIRQVLNAARQINHGKLIGGLNGVDTWINELIWREFYKHILYGFPRVSMHHAFKIPTENIQWENNTLYFKAWCQGKTGYPIIDAAMRQLAQTGWMHNRLRMLVAMFLVKDLLIDWRWGEKFFMQHLIDGDLAANNGGWQWAASTGTDAAPYFRIFNPITQSKKFDPEGHFIRKFCPELKMLDNTLIHEPYAKGALSFSIDYPQPIINHAEQREKFLRLYKKSH